MESAAPCPRELTGGNSPHTTNQPRKKKTDRVPCKFFSSAQYPSETAESGVSSRTWLNEGRDQAVRAAPILNSGRCGASA